MRRVLALLVGAGIAVGGGATAWAGTAGASGPKREAARACLDQAREADPEADRAELKAAVKACLKEAGIEARTPTPEQQAKREALRNCVQAAKAAHPEDKAAARAAARACLDQAGITKGRLRAKLAGARECLAEVRGDHPNASKSEVRALVKDCVAAKE
ncbi:MAG: hypothetical protein ACR2KK_10290 [Acidimicrobiales bacterium]